MGVSLTLVDHDLNGKRHLRNKGKHMDVRFRLKQPLEEVHFFFNEMSKLENVEHMLQNFPTHMYYPILTRQCVLDREWNQKLQEWRYSPERATAEQRKEISEGQLLQQQASI